MPICGSSKRSTALPVATMMYTWQMHEPNVLGTRRPGLTCHAMPLINSTESLRALTVSGAVLWGNLRG